MSESLSRRQLLTRAGAAGAALSVGGLLPSGRALAAFDNLGGYPFVAGVASGDPGPERVVLWTKLALDALGQVALPNRRIPVAWEVAEDERMRRVRHRGLTFSDPRHDHSIHLDLDGLHPGREYWYRFHAGGEVSPVGRTRTAPDFGHGPRDLRFCFVSCSQFEHGYFTAYKHIVEDDPAFLIHVGDYIYEYGTDVYRAPSGNVRHHVGDETMTLADYRRRYGQYHTDPDLLEARRLIPFITTPDDHEVENNYANVISERDTEPDQDPAVFLRRRTAAYTAYAEWMPLRTAQVRPDGSLRLFRELPMGDLCDVIVADTRQFRTDQPCDDKFNSVCAGMDDPAQTLPGLPQERWLVKRFARSRARWNMLAQQVQMAQEDFKEGPDQGYNTDAWDGYKQSRRRVLSGIERSGARNPVVLTGDVHQHYAADLKVDFLDPAAPIVASEFVGTSITSGGDGNDTVQAAALRENPWIKYNANRRGYVRIDMNRSRLHADMRPALRQPPRRARHDGRQLRDRGRHAGPAACIELLDRSSDCDPPWMPLNHVALTVADRARSAAFYGAHFGLTERVHDDAHLLILGSPDGSLLALSEGAVPAALPRTNHFGFQVERADQVHLARARLREAGVPETEWQEDRGFVRVQVTDPDGYRVELFAY